MKTGGEDEMGYKNKTCQVEKYEQDHFLDKGVANVTINSTKNNETF